MQTHLSVISKVPYEQLFAETVLSRIGVDFANVMPQRAMRDADGKRRFIDFAIEEGPLVRLAIEVDGYEKRGHPMNRREFKDLWEREAAIAAEGWHIIRFANGHVRDRPEHCARNIDLALKALRTHAFRLADAEARLERAEFRLSEALSELETREVEDLKAERLARLARLETEIERQQKENQRMKTMAIATAAIIAAVAVIVAVFVVQGDDTPAEASACTRSLSWQEARGHVGKNATVRGTVVKATYARSSRSKPTYLDLGKSYPASDRFVAVIFQDDRGNFRRPPEDTYEGKDIAVTGKVTVFRGTAQIVINHPNDIGIC